MTVRHRQKEFNDAILRPYGATKRVCDNYFGDECEITIVSDMPEGVGKSGYIHHVLADTYGYISCRDKELLKTMWLKAEKRIEAPKWPTDWEACMPVVRRRLVGWLVNNLRGKVLGTCIVHMWILSS